ncbi:hypothetical protein SDC9_142095 [bioreactor metagenome]|uniref:Uncharacterized protein n=1 Tax=bioreactor metagenome TaxID=1076179 RepID=A0A645E042_9ZZZZ
MVELANGKSDLVFCVPIPFFNFVTAIRSVAFVFLVNINTGGFDISLVNTQSFYLFDNTVHLFGDLTHSALFAAFNGIDTGINDGNLIIYLALGSAHDRNRRGCFHFVGTPRWTEWAQAEDSQQHENAAENQKYIGGGGGKFLHAAIVADSGDNSKLKHYFSRSLAYLALIQAAWSWN